MENILNIPIIHEDANILVINKPSGLVVNNAKTVSGSTLMDWIEERGFNSLDNITASEFELRRGVIHRLDKGTSGVMVIAKDKESFERIQSQFKNRLVTKEYIALVHADGLKQKLLDPAFQRFVVDVPIGRNPKNRLKWAVVANGRNALTEFTISKIFSEPLMLLNCFPKTGRTHQIRVHLAAINCPVVCDKLYLNRRDYNSDSKWCPRIFLHASRLSFMHPISGDTVSFVADLPEDLKIALEKLES